MKQQLVNLKDCGFLASLGSIVIVALTDVFLPSVEICVYGAAILYSVYYVQSARAKVMAENPMFAVAVRDDLEAAAAKLKKGKGEKNEFNE